jgi:hypothetical protein
VVCLTVDGKDVKHVTVHHSFLWPQREVSFNDLAAELKRYNAYGTTRLNAVPIVWEQLRRTLRRTAHRARLRDAARRSCLQRDARDRPRLTMEIEERMRKRLFSVEPADNAAWLEEHARFGIGNDGQIPLTGYPLMSATRHAFAQLDRARLPGEKSAPIVYPKRRYL